MPGLIAGQVIDWKTGKPAPYVDVHVKTPNASQFAARTDAHGRFSFQPRNPPDVYFLFAASPQYGRLLRATLGQTAVLYRKGQRVRDVVIPAIPATELSGHVYGNDGKAISGCDVSALTRANPITPTSPSDLSSADDSNNLMEVENSQADVNGMYVFCRLGADRYFVLARCKEAHTGKSMPSAWVPALYPDVKSIASAQEIVLLPGDHRTGVDFHMQRQRAYSLNGKIIFSDHLPPKPWSEVTYSQSLFVFRSDRALTSTWLGQEPCQIDANAGTFRCDSLLAGDYTFYFEVSEGVSPATMVSASVGRNIPRQTAKVRYRVPAEAKQTLTVQLQNVADEERHQMHSTGSGGNLNFRKVCDTAPDGRPAIRILAWGQRRAAGDCYYMTFTRNTSFRLPKDYYNVIGFEDAFVPRNHSYFGNSSKFEDALMQHGIRVKLDIGQTIEPALPVLTTTQLINIALTSVKAVP